MSPGSLANVYWYGPFLDPTRMRLDQIDGPIGEEMLARTNQASKGNTSDVPTTEANELRRYGLKRFIDFDASAETYVTLKNNFSDVGQYDGVAWAYRKEQEMKG